MDIYGNEAYNIKKVLERMTDIQQEILKVLMKPENPIVRGLKFVALVTGAMAFLIIIEKIIILIKGGF